MRRNPLLSFFFVSAEEEKPVAQIVDTKTHIFIFSTRSFLYTIKHFPRFWLFCTRPHKSSRVAQEKDERVKKERAKSRRTLHFVDVKAD